MRMHVLTLPCAFVAFAAIALAPTPARAQFPCQNGRYSMYSPGSLGVPADVRVQCTGSGFVMDVQWPFVPEAEWHNVYALNSASRTLAITVGGRPVANLEFSENPQAPPRFLIEGCPPEYGGTGAAVPWNDPCVRKVYHLVQRDFYFIKEIFLRSGAPSSDALVQAMEEMARTAGDGGDNSEPVPIGGGPGDVEPTKPPTWMDEFRDSHPPMSVEAGTMHPFPGLYGPGHDSVEKTASPPPEAGAPAPGTTIVPTAALPPAEEKP